MCVSFLRYGVAVLRGGVEEGGWRTTFFAQDNGGKYSKHSLFFSIVKCSPLLLLHSYGTNRWVSTKKCGTQVTRNQGRTIIKINTKWNKYMLDNNGEL